MLDRMTEGPQRYIVIAAVAAPTNAPTVRAKVSQRLRENPFDTTIHLRFDDQPDVQPSDLCPYIGVRTAYL